MTSHPASTPEPAATTGAAPTTRPTVGVTPTTSAAIEAVGLTKSYGTLKVLSGLDLRVETGTVFSLLAPNGAGKTTVVRILATLLWADAGQARVAGYDVRTERRQVRRRISLTGQYAAVDDQQTGAENLRMMGALVLVAETGAQGVVDVGG